MQISGKTGDNGFTDLIGGKRLKKDHPVMECLGTLDELNAFLGDAKAALSEGDVAEMIAGIQKDLFTLMGILAGMPVPAGGMAVSGLGEDRINRYIEELEVTLPEIASFAIPGANPVSAKFHIARTVCRRAERRLIGISDETEAAAVLPYINRLSALLFLLSQKYS